MGFVLLPIAAAEHTSFGHPSFRSRVRVQDGSSSITDNTSQPDIGITFHLQKPVWKLRSQRHLLISRWRISPRLACSSPDASHRHHFNITAGSKSAPVPEPISVTIDVGSGENIILETGVLARQADGAVLLRCGKTVLLASVCSSASADENIDFLPLSVDYQEKFSAAGRFPGNFVKREAKLSDYEVLISRLVDRAIRPLFPDDYHAETQIVITLFSADPTVAPDALAALAASAALAVSDIPFQGPVSEVRVARVNGKLTVNPPVADIALADINLVVSGSHDSINMVEGQMKEVSKEDMIEAILVAHDAIKIQCEAQQQLAARVGKLKREYSHERPGNPELRASMHDFLAHKIRDVARSKLPKHERNAAFDLLFDQWLASQEFDEDEEALSKLYFRQIKKKTIREFVLQERTRLDGRNLDEVRSIWSATDVLPSVHGSCVFTRGETQALATITLGTKSDEQMLDGVMNSGSSRFLLHYNFPSFCTGEIKPNRAPGRREIGHGNLAQRAIEPMLPADFPYTIRVVSDVLESNGSSSMATVCATSLALFDAGVPLARPVAGIAMGLISADPHAEFRDDDDIDAPGAPQRRYAILSDILGDEDALGDMDFKLAGTAAGLTACQMDIKMRGLDGHLLGEAIAQAERGRAHILDCMNECQDKARSPMKPFVPRIESFPVPRKFVGAIIGQGGKTIQSIEKETGAKIMIMEKDDEWSVVEVSSPNHEACERAVGTIQGICMVPELGNTYKGTVKTITSFGAFVQFLPNKEGLLHISEVSWSRLADLEGVLNEGDELEVKLIEIDERSGKYRLSRRALLPKPAADAADDSGAPHTRPASVSNGAAEGARDGDRRPLRSGGRPPRRTNDGDAPRRRTQASENSS
mmetsp:Transcript_7735/g.13270  ORF Transcript_7735/g.13270 Transcript_7735/m.13270 type:complete len:876 (-) Transcript_7735:226-2853(-)